MVHRIGGHLCKSGGWLDSHIRLHFVASSVSLSQLGFEWEPPSLNEWRCESWNVLAFCRELEYVTMQFKQVNVKSECIPRQAIKAYGRGGGEGGGLTPIINFPNIYIYIYIYIYMETSYILL